MVRGVHRGHRAGVHSIAAAATLRVVQSLPYIFFGTPAGALIDRVDKRQLVIACDIAGIALAVAIPLSALGGVFSIELLYVIGFLLGTVEVLWGVTTDFSVVPSLVEEHELTDANTLAVFYRMPPILEISAGEVAPLTVRNVIHEIGDGFAFVWRLKVLRWLLVVSPSLTSAASACGRSSSVCCARSTTSTR